MTKATNNYREAGYSVEAFIGNMMWKGAAYYDDNGDTYLLLNGRFVRFYNDEVEYFITESGRRVWQPANFPEYICEEFENRCGKLAEACRTIAKAEDRARAYELDGQSEAADRAWVGANAMRQMLWVCMGANTMTVNDVIRCLAELDR